MESKKITKLGVTQPEPSAAIEACFLRLIDQARAEACLINADRVTRFADLLRLLVLYQISVGEKDWARLMLRALGKQA